MVEEAILTVAILTLIVAAVTLILIGFDIKKRYSPDLVVKITSPQDDPQSLNDELIISNRGGTSVIEEVHVGRLDRNVYDRQKIWEGNELLESNKIFRTKFFLGEPEDTPSSRIYRVEIRHSGRVEDRLVIKEQAVQ